MTRLRVGIIGAGPVTQAIHLPTLARLADKFQIVHVSDVNAEVAAAVAARAGARWSTSHQELVDDPEVEVVAICSPAAFHADQVIDVIDAHKRGILCEKPFADSPEQASRLAAHARAASVPVLVAAMHTFDLGWLATAPYWDDLRGSAHTVHSSILLPFNPRFEDVATEIITRPAMAPMDLNDPKTRGALMHGAVMGLAIHDLPLIRKVVPQLEAVHHAAVTEPFGYLITASSSQTQVTLAGHMNPVWQPRWTLDVWSDQAHLHLNFPPSYVHAGGAIATLKTADATQVFGPDRSNGYTEEWLSLWNIVTEESGAADLLDDHLADLDYAITLAERSQTLVERS